MRIFCIHFYVVVVTLYIMDVLYTRLRCNTIGVIPIRFRVKLKYLFKILNIKYIIHNILMSQKPNCFNELH